MTVEAGGRGIAIVGINYPPERTGIAPYTGALARGLAARGCDVTVATAQPHYPEWHIHEGYHRWRGDEVDSGVEVHRRLHLVPEHPQGVARLVSELSFGGRVSLDGGLGHPDVMLLVSPALFATALLEMRTRLMSRRTKVVVWVQDLYGKGVAETAGGGVVERTMRAVEGRVLRAADRVVVIHDQFRETICDEYGVDPAKVAVVRNWTHLSAHAPIDRAVARAALGWGDETVLLHAGNMGVKQGLDHVVKAAKVASERGERLRFVMVGDGGERARLEALAAGVASIEFIDPLDDEPFRQALAAADALLVHEAPGVSEMAVPSKLTSYFDAGRPVVAATDPFGITAQEVRAADAGIVVQSGDLDALIGAALRLGADAVRADALGLNGRAYRERVLSEAAAIDAFAALLGIRDRRRASVDASTLPFPDRRAPRTAPVQAPNVA
ncbi:glycosyltransferase [Demequina mangrovi]|uniref:D-inositol 3-phosphate glycosyltransferase n=1 Tax=Demequina mangrovi TaxID=1043493 RepID=A0A1H6YLR1_9MICO|nr:glycosyltransferase [Demequina mangrovi]SEJ40764.1 Glycosyltransferase involved in cell wall bisynthesis [Demequina mangrovi]